MVGVCCLFTNIKRSRRTSDDPPDDSTVIAQFRRGLSEETLSVLDLHNVGQDSLKAMVKHCKKYHKALYEGKRKREEEKKASRSTVKAAKPSYFCKLHKAKSKAASSR